ncbi:MAG: NUDIX domain-containing protein [Candidatus Pacebacteria bacterium]|nr:NUDIX domain-containing protein [Candidatus Paceibacterota bacterium]
MDFKHATLVFPITPKIIVLGEKKVRWGAGFLNAPGGRIEPEETPEQAAIRELKEELELTASTDDLEKVAMLYMYIDDSPKFAIHTYLAHKWSGEPRESDELIPEIHPLHAIPYDRMWPADQAWMTLVFDGERICKRIFLESDGDPQKPNHFARMEDCVSPYAP